MRVAARRSHPHPDKLLTFMVVLTRHTFKWTVRRKYALWAAGIAAVICCIAVFGSGYGLWATKKIWDFGDLERETREQQNQLRESLDKADMLQRELTNLQALVESLMKQIDPRGAPSGITERQGLESNEASDQSQKVAVLKGELNQAEGRLKNIQSNMAPIIDRWNHTPSVEPTRGIAMSNFGMRIHPFFRTNENGDGLTSFHSGIDIANELGTPIQATANGVVTSASYQTNYGLTVVIRHSPELETLYAHMQSIFVREGQEVIRGQIIGTMGRTGRATGVHLHYEVRKNGSAVNPKPYLRLQRQWLSGLR
jgi:murein DD-endopeptidase MepM/ murein hydrolase activator NlpD